MKSNPMVLARAAVQALCLAAFAYSALGARLGWPTLIPYDSFMMLDPLAWLLSTIAGRSPAAGGWAALGTVLATLALGPVFCGWMCPMGTAIDAAGVLKGKRPAVRRFGEIRSWILAAMIAAAVAGSSFAAWLDPLSIFTRALHLDRGAPHEIAGAVAGWALLAAAVGLTALGPRSWCRTICPLGAILSMIGRLAPYRRLVASSCRACGACIEACPMYNPPREDPRGRCMGCRRCEAACPDRAISFGFAAARVTSAGGKGKMGMSRRGLFLSIPAGAAAGVIVRRAASHPVLRPPGAAAGGDFAARCVSCGTCLAVCPTGGLLPLVDVRRPDALFTPRLVPRVGPCMPDCTACGDSCPTGAIAKIAAASKPAVKMGLAVIDPSRCLPWARGEKCLVCRQACPPGYGAIELRPDRPSVPKPHVKEDRCTGCGICEHDCPEAAIAVVPPPDRR